MTANLLFSSHQLFPTNNVTQHYISPARQNPGKLYSLDRQKLSLSPPTKGRIIIRSPFRAKCISLFPKIGIVKCLGDPRYKPGGAHAAKSPKSRGFCLYASFPFLESIGLPKWGADLEAESLRENSAKTARPGLRLRNQLREKIGWTIPWKKPQWLWAVSNDGERVVFDYSRTGIFLFQPRRPKPFGLEPKKMAYAIEMRYFSPDGKYDPDFFG